MGSSARHHASGDGDPRFIRDLAFVMGTVIGGVMFQNSIRRRKGDDLTLGLSAGVTGSFIGKECAAFHDPLYWVFFSSPFAQVDDTSRPLAIPQLPIVFLFHSSLSSP